MCTFLCHVPCSVGSQPSVDADGAWQGICDRLVLSVQQTYFSAGQASEGTSDARDTALFATTGKASEPPYSSHSRSAEFNDVDGTGADWDISINGAGVWGRACGDIATTFHSTKSTSYKEGVIKEDKTQVFPTEHEADEYPTHSGRDGSARHAESSSELSDVFTESLTHPEVGALVGPALEWENPFQVILCRYLKTNWAYRAPDCDLSQNFHLTCGRVLAFRRYCSLLFAVEFSRCSGNKEAFYKFGRTRYPRCRCHHATAGISHSVAEDVYHVSQHKTSLLTEVSEWRLQYTISQGMRLSL